MAPYLESSHHHLVAGIPSCRTHGDRFELILFSIPLAHRKTIRQEGLLLKSLEIFWHLSGNGSAPPFSHALLIAIWILWAAHGSQVHFEVEVLL